VTLELLLAYLRSQGHYCGTHHSPMYAAFCEFLARDVEAHGMTADLLDPWTRPGAPVGRDVPALRLLGGVHRIVLSGRAPELGSFYPSVGGTSDPRDAWPVLRAALVDHAPELRRSIEHPPQTNEVGRAVPLLGGLRHVSAWTGGMPVRLVEIGASAGLNLRADHLPIGPGQLIDAELPLSDAPVYEIVARIGGDVAPVDITSEAGRTTLMSYIWPDDTVRLERLRAAVAIAREVPVDLRRLSAADLVESVRLESGTVLVLWHSVMWQYVREDERERVMTALAALGSQARDDARLAHLFLEPPVPGRPGSRELAHEIRLTTWPGADNWLLGAAPAHGIPVHWTVPLD
jgi:hypothetical protein